MRLVAVDGHAGSGKTTFAARLAGALGGAPVLHLDDVASHEELFGWLPRLRRQVLEPFAEGRDAEVPVYDWVARRFGPAVRLPCASVVVVEGVGAGRSGLRPWLSAVLWMDVGEREAWAAGQRRDGPELSAFWRLWSAAERAHFAADPTRPHAHWLVARAGGGHRLVPAPGGAGGGPDSTADGDTA